MTFAVLPGGIAMANLGNGDDVCDGDTLSVWLLAWYGCLIGGDIVECIGGKLVLKYDEGGGGSLW